MTSIFISYRRSDSGGHAGRLHDRLAHWFDRDALFYDLDTIDSGEIFPARLEQAVNAARVVLVLIGPDWLSELERRAKLRANDFVRCEVELALNRIAAGEDLSLIPVLLGGAAMPSVSSLQDSLLATLHPLCAIDGHSFQGKNDDWQNQFVRLRNRIAQLPGVPVPRYRAPAGSEKPFRVIEHSLSAHFQDPNELLVQLRASLQQAGSAAVVARAALYGMGGVGKTQLALKYSLDYCDAYAGVWWLRAETDATLQLDARDCCMQVSAPIGDGELPSAALKRWLATQPGGWLLVFDNAESSAALRPHLPDGRLHHVIITSRNPAWGGLAQPVELDVWSGEQAALFLAQRLPGAARTELLALANDLGGLPLALEQAASYVDETGTTVAAYRTLLAGVDTGGLTLDAGRAATGYERSVAATLSLSFDRLSPAAAQLLRLCAFAAAEPLPERFFLEGRELLPAELAAAAAAPLDWDGTVGELRRYGLAERVAMASLDRSLGQVTGGPEQAFSLHRLTQQICRVRLAVSARDCRVFEAVLRAACPREVGLPANWPHMAALSQHVTQLDRFSDGGWLDMRAYSGLLGRVGAYLECGPALYSESARWLGRALAIDRAELGEEHPNTLTSMNNLAGTLTAQGDLSGARKLQERVLEVRRRVLGEEHSDTLGSMTNLAGTLRAQGDLPGARKLDERALEVSRRVRDEEHPDALTSMNNLAETLMAQGDLRGARTLEERVLEVRRRLLGEEHPGTLNSMNNLAGTLRAQGDLPGARKLQERALEVRRRVLGEEHPGTLTSMNNLAGTLRAQGDLPGARKLQERVLEVSRRVLGEEHPNTLTSMNNLAATLTAQGDLSGARKLQERVLEVSCRVRDEEHPDTLGSMNNLAETLRAQGDLPGARKLQERVLEVSCRVRDEEHPDTLTSMNNLALTLWAQGDLRGARTLEERVLEVRRRLLGEEHPNTLTSKNNLAITLWNSGEQRDAIELMRAAADGSAKSLGEGHADTQARAAALVEMLDSNHSKLTS